jgi:hypothetical protein
MSKNTGLISLALSIVALGLSALVFVLTLTGANAQQAAPDTSESEVQYVMYLGTNDKDTNQPVCSPEEAQAKAEGILLDHFGGYTIQEANGGWIDGDATYQEYTLVIYLSDTTLEQVHQAADELLRVFNQSSVMISTNPTATEFYDGSD